MKIRTDFVTNSSSSSFILSFNTENDFDEFEYSCNDLGYEEFLKLIRKRTSDRILMSSLSKNKEGCTAAIRKLLEINERYRGSDRLRLELLSWNGEDLEATFVVNTLEEKLIGENVLPDEMVDEIESSFSDVSVIFASSDDEISKAKAKQMVIWNKTISKRNELIKENVPDIPGEDYIKYLVRKNDYMASPEFIKELKEFAEGNEELQKELKQIKESWLTINSTVWESGSMLGWAIRHGFIQDVFPEYVVDVINGE